MMQRRVVHGGTDVSRAQTVQDLVARAAEVLDGELDQEQVTRVEWVRHTPLGGNGPRHLRQFVQIQRGNGAAPLGEFPLPSQLHAADRRLQIGQVHLVADLMDVGRPWRACLDLTSPGIARQRVLAQRPQAFGHPIVVQRNGTAITRREILVRIEAEAGEVSRAAHGRAIHVAGAKRVRGVLNERNVCRDDVADRVHVDGMPAEMHDHHRAGPRRQPLADRFGSRAKRVRFHIAEHRRSARVQRGVRGTDPGQARHDHFVAQPHAVDEQRQEQGRGARVDGDHVTGSARIGELAFEGERLGSHADPP